MTAKRPDGLPEDVLLRSLVFLTDDMRAIARLLPALDGGADLQATKYDRGRAPGGVYRDPTADAAVRLRHTGRAAVRRGARDKLTAACRLVAEARADIEHEAEKC